MAEKSLKRQAVSGIFWKLAETGGAQVVNLIIGMVLARLIMPSQFGAIAMLSIFLAVAGTFIDSGFSSALIRKTDRTQADCSTVFYFNIVISVIAYAILYFCAPWVSDFYDMPVLTPVLRVSALSLIIGGFTSVQGTLYNADMQFKTMAKFRMVSLVVSGSVGIVMAYKDYQVWALVAQSLTNQTLSSLCYWIYSKWRPAWVFSMQSFKEFFGFGSKLLASGLLDTIYSNMYGVIIGKVFKAADLAFYNKAGNINSLTSSMPTGILQSVTYPTLCKINNDDAVLRNGYLRILRLSAFIIFPLCLGAGAVAYPLINVMYTDRWIYTAALLQIIVFSGMWYPIHAINLNLLIVKGRSDLFFRLEVIKKIIGVAMLCITVPIGLKAMCYGGIATSILCLAVNTHYTGKLLDLGFWQQMRDYLPFLLLSLLMFAVCRMVTSLLGMGALSLVAGVLTGILVYGGGSLLFKFPEWQELKNLRK